MKKYWNANLPWAITATLAIAVVWAVSAIANYYFGASLGTDKPFDALLFQTTTSQIFSYASLASDVLKCVVLFAFFASMATKQWRAMMVTGAMWVVCTAWSVASAVGFVAINHNSVTDIRGKGVEEWAQLDAQVKSLSERRRQIAAARPEGTVQAEINQLLRTPGVDGCAAINGPITQQVCPQVDRLRIELANAKSAAWLDGRLDELRAEVGRAERVTSENPFAELAGGLLGIVATQKVTTWQALWFALLLELISGPGLWAIWAAVPKSARDAQEAAKAPEATSAAPVVASPAPRPRVDALTKISGVDVRKDIGQTDGIAAEVSDEHTPRPMIGLYSQLTPEQQKLFWNWDGPEYLGPAEDPKGPDGPGTPMSPASDIEQMPSEGDIEPAAEKVIHAENRFKDLNPKSEWKIKRSQADTKDFVRECLGIDEDALRAMKTAIKERRALDKHVGARLASLPDVYDIYTTWCASGHLAPKGQKAFSGELWSHLGLPKGTRKMKGVKGIRAASGLRFPVYAKQAERRYATG